MIESLWVHGFDKISREKLRQLRWNSIADHRCDHGILIHRVEDVVHGERLENRRLAQRDATNLIRIVMAKPSRSML